MRVTFNAIQGSLEAINTAAAQFARAQDQVATGKRVQRPSDDPTSSERAIQDSSEIGTIDAYNESSNNASARLSAIDGALSAMTDILTTALATATQGHGDTPDQVSRDTASVKVTGLRDAMAGALNTTFRGTYLFSGSKAQTQPYANGGGGWAYSGDATTVTVDTAYNRSVALAVDGQAIAKGGDPTDVLSTLDTLATAIQSGDNPTIATSIDALNRAFSRVIQAQSRVGNDETVIADGQQQLTSLRLAGIKRLSDDQDANFAEAVTQMNRAQTAYKAALSAVGQSSQLSLMDFLR